MTKEEIQNIVDRLSARSLTQTQLNYILVQKGLSREDFLNILLKYELKRTFVVLIKVVLILTSLWLFLR